jgi:hypothetical protein
MKNKTLAVWLTFWGGPLGLHRWYLRGRVDWLALCLPLLSVLGAYGVSRARTLGVDDMVSWALIPLLGFSWAGCALNAIVYGLQSCEAWNQRFNPVANPSDAAGATRWLTILGVICALLLGATMLMASLAFSIQRYFEYQVEQAYQLSQPAPNQP